MNVFIRRWALVASVLVLCGLPLNRLHAQNSEAAEPAAKAEHDEVKQDLRYGVGSVLASVFYSPLKVTYAGLGLMTGGLGYLLSAGNPDVANNIIYPAVMGNYVITPGHLKGMEPVIFIGPPPPGQKPVETSMATAAP